MVSVSEGTAAANVLRQKGECGGGGEGSRRDS